MESGGLDVDGALTALGELLSANGHEFGIVILGGAALTLLGIVQRATLDVDVLALAVSENGELRVFNPDPLPDALIIAVQRVARDLSLPASWLNTVIAAQWRTGLPDGFETRLQWRQYSGLTVGILDRIDLIFFKLFALADVGPRSKHLFDLLALKPTDTELFDAAEWLRTQDVSTEFAGELNRAVAHVRRKLEDSDF